jgi:cellulose synthase/poly-beta-1,6-N-acetylglucosamine synthase-like glycosyltransferase
MLVMQMLKWLLLGMEIIVAAPVLYLCVVSIAAMLVSRKQNGKVISVPTFSRFTRFAVLVPAHDEEAILGNLLKSLDALDYPKEHFAVHVVADNCIDGTATLVRATGWIQVYERFDAEKRGKGYALSWLFKQLEYQQLRYDAYVILDADSVVDSAFLQTMHKQLAQGTRALQACYTVLNATDSPGTALRWIALSLINYVRPLGRNALGGSSTLTGNGMCLSRDLLEQYPWQAFSLTEDYQYYLNLVLHGERIRFVPDAKVCSIMPVSFAQMRTQDIRWETYASNQPAWKTTWRLLCAGISKRDPVRLEAILELLTPPLSLLVSWCLLVLVGSLLLWSLPGLLVSMVLVASLICYLCSAIYLLRPPRAVYMALSHAPGFMLWKLWVVLVVRRSKKHTSEWVRTSRTA